MGLNEAELQKVCVGWFKRQYSGVLIYHSPNEGKRTYQYMAWLKQLGTISGCPDLLIFQPTEYCGLAIELKSGKGKLTENQEWFLNELKKANWQTNVIYDLNEFMTVVNRYMEKVKK